MCYFWIFKRAPVPTGAARVTRNQLKPPGDKISLWVTKIYPKIFSNNIKIKSVCHLQKSPELPQTIFGV